MTLLTRIASLEPIADSYDLFLIDQFGVLHDGVKPYAGAVDCLLRLKQSGKSIILLTNSGKGIAANEARLTGLGISRNLFDHVVTSGEAASRGILASTFGEPFTARHRAYIGGREGDDYSFSQLGLVLAPLPQDADFIIFAGSDAPRTSLKQYAELLLPAVALAIPALCCNPDRLMITPEGLQPSAGEIANVYGQLGGRVLFVGKPHPRIYGLAMALSPDTDPKRILVIGDSVEHDICGGLAAGISTALVRTGIGASLNEGQVLDAMRHFEAFPNYILPALQW
jgi:HAD superfamily hydrolase (TIGR01459 family)